MKTFDRVLKACWDAAWQAAHATAHPTPASRYVRDLAFDDWRAQLGEPLDDGDAA